MRGLIRPLAVVAIVLGLASLGFAGEWRRVGPTEHALFEHGRQVGTYDTASAVWRSFDWRTGAWGAAEAPPWAPAIADGWHRHDEDPAYRCLFEHGVQIGGYDFDTDEYRTYDAGTGVWGPPQVPPWGKATRPQQRGNYGIDPRYQPAAPATAPAKYRIKGKPATRAEAIEATRTGKLPDDANRLRVTAIGPGAAAVLKDLQSAPALAPLRDQLVVKAYENPSDWAVAGHKATGQPTVSIQEPSGRELSRQNDYDGPDSLARAIGEAQALRGDDPNYDPSKTPDLRSGMSMLAPTTVTAPLWALAAFGLVLPVLKRILP